MSVVISDPAFIAAVVAAGDHLVPCRTSETSGDRHGRHSLRPLTHSPIVWSLSRSNPVSVTR